MCVIPKVQHSAGQLSRAMDFTSLIYTCLDC